MNLFSQAVCAFIRDRLVRNFTGLPVRLFVLFFIILHTSLLAQTRLGIFYTQEEVNAWKQRIANGGPYLTQGDAGHIYSPEGYTRIIENKDDFLGYTNSRYYWQGPASTPASGADLNSPTIGSGSLLTSNKLEELTDAAFYALTTNNTTEKNTITNRIKEILLTQTNTLTYPKLKFNDTNIWEITPPPCTPTPCTNRQTLHDGAHELGKWLASLIMAYDLIKYADFTQQEKDQIHVWFYHAGNYLSTIIDNSLLNVFPSRDSDNYSNPDASRLLVSQSSTAYIVKNTSGEYQQKKSFLALHRFYTNRRAVAYRFVAFVGALQNSPELFGPMHSDMTRDLKGPAKKFFIESIRYGMFPDGEMSDMHRGFEGDPWDKPNQGWSYACVMLGALTDMASVYARMGDYSLFDYNTNKESPVVSENKRGVAGSAGPDKTLMLGITNATRYLDGSHLVDPLRYGLIKAVLYSTSATPPSIPDASIPFYTESITVSGSTWTRSPKNAKWSIEKIYTGSTSNVYTYSATWTEAKEINVQYKVSTSKPALTATGWVTTYPEATTDTKTIWFSVKGVSESAWSNPHMLYTAVDLESWRINSEYSLVNDPFKSGYGHDASLVQANLYYKDAYNKYGYMRNGPNMKPYQASMNGTGGNTPGQGAFGIWPDVFFMYGQYENQIWPFPNLTLVANAGPDKSITTSSTSLIGSATNGTGTIASYAWTQTSGSPATMSGATSTTLSLSNLVAGTYTFKLTVTDDKGSTAWDEATVTVNPCTQTSYLASPYNNANPVTSPAYVSAPVSGVSSYTIEINTNASFTGTSIVKTGGQVQSFTNVAFQQKYYARVKTNLCANWGNVTSFTTGSVDQFTYFTQPSNGQTITTHAFVANTVPSASSYTIEINTNSTFTGTGWVQTSGNRTMSSANLTPGLTYWARVKTNLSPNWSTPIWITKASSGGRIDFEGNVTEANTLAVYPNPFKDNITIDLSKSSEGLALVSLVDVLGKLYYQTSKVLSTGDSEKTVILPAKNLKQGIYFVKVAHEKDKQQVIRVIKQ